MKENQNLYDILRLIICREKALAFEDNSKDAIKDIEYEYEEKEKLDEIYIQFISIFPIQIYLFSNIQFDTILRINKNTKTKLSVYIDGVFRKNGKELQLNTLNIIFKINKQDRKGLFYR